MPSIHLIVLTVGPLLLIGLLYWAYARNKKVPPEVERESDRGTRKLQDDIERHQHDTEPFDRS